MLRYVKQFTGTKKIPSYKTVLQQWVTEDDQVGCDDVSFDINGVEGHWEDLTPENSVWESEKDRIAFEQASKYFFERSYR